MKQSIMCQNEQMQAKIIFACGTFRPTCGKTGEPRAH